MSYDTCFQKLPTMKTERLILRQISDSEQDGRDCLEFINDYSVYRFWGLYDENSDPSGRKKPKPVNKLDYHYKATMEEYSSGNELTWLMELADTHKVIGEIVLYDFRLKRQADIGYRINKDYWGKGYATEAARAVMKVAFEIMELTRLQIRCFNNNPGSSKVAQKLGFRLEGLIRQAAIINVMTDYNIFGYLKDEYNKNPIDDSLVTIN